MKYRIGLCNPMKAREDAKQCNDKKKSSQNVSVSYAKLLIFLSP